MVGFSLLQIEPEAPRRPRHGLLVLSGALKRLRGAGAYPDPMRAARAQWDCLRLAAKAADRAKAAEELRPDFERRLRELGYGPLGVAHAFNLLSGPGTVTDALEALER
jgi:hypothetical protein